MNINGLERRQSHQETSQEEPGAKKIKKIAKSHMDPQSHGKKAKKKRLKVASLTKALQKTFGKKSKASFGAKPKKPVASYNAAASAAAISGMDQLIAEMKAASLADTSTNKAADIPVVKVVDTASLDLRIAGYEKKAAEYRIEAYEAGTERNTLRQDLLTSKAEAAERIKNRLIAEREAVVNQANLHFEPKTSAEPTSSVEAQSHASARSSAKAAKAQKRESYEAQKRERYQKIRQLTAELLACKKEIRQLQKQVHEVKVKRVELIIARDLVNLRGKKVERLGAAHALSMQEAKLQGLELDEANLQTKITDLQKELKSLQIAKTQQKTQSSSLVTRSVSKASLHFQDK